MQYKNEPEGEGRLGVIFKLSQAFIWILVGHMGAKL